MKIVLILLGYLLLKKLLKEINGVVNVISKIEILIDNKLDFNFEWFIINILITVKERKKMSKQKYWSGDKLEILEPNEVFVFGSNPVL